MTKEAEVLAWLACIVQDAQVERIYGSLTISFESGKITTVRKEQCFKPPKKTD